MKIGSITAPNPGPFTLNGTRTYLLGETAIIDPGPDIESHVAAILEAMPRLDTIFITHRHEDHAPAALPLKQATGARIIAPLDIADVRVAGGETFNVDVWRLSNTAFGNDTLNSLKVTSLLPQRRPVPVQ